MHVALHGTAPWWSWVRAGESDSELERLRRIRIVVIGAGFTAFLIGLAFTGR
jgi:hypothetical protein